MTLKVAIAGAGHIANVHANAIKAQAGELVAVIEKFPDRAAAFAQKFGVKNQYTTVEEALHHGKFDAMVIATPNFLHAPQAIAALTAGVPVFVEKPMATSAIEGEQMLEASLQSGVTLMVGHCWRFDEEVLWLKQQTSRLGKIVRTKGYGVHTHWGPEGWFTQKQLAGGGAMADTGIHALDTACYLLNSPKPLSVFARMGTYYRDIEVDDTGIIIVNWEGGATSYIESGWCQPYVDGPQAATQLYGTHGFGQVFPTRLLLPNPNPQTGLERFLPTRIRNKLKLNGPIEVKSGFKFPRKAHYAQAIYDRQMAHFFECVQSKHAPITGAIAGLINVKIIDAAYRSAQTSNVEAVNI